MKKPYRGDLPGIVTVIATIAVMILVAYLVYACRNPYTGRIGH